MAFNTQTGNPASPQTATRAKQQIIVDIENITGQRGFLYTFAFLCARDLFLDAREAADKNWQDSLSYQELGFLAGLMLKHPIQIAYPSEEDWENQVGI